MILITYNTNNPVGLGVVMNGAVVDVWTSLISQYEAQCQLAMHQAK